MTDLSSFYKGVFNLCVSSVERGDEVIFTHNIKAGPASKSYGIEVAKLAGLPRPLIARARELLALFTKEAERKRAPTSDRQLSIFAEQIRPSAHGASYRERPDQNSDSGATISENVEVEKVISFAQSIDINNTTPVQSLQLLSQLVEQIGTIRGKSS
jgi:DNA mismatch repair protein MutS